MAVFARKASGLVREAGLFDTFLWGFMNNGLGVGLWTMQTWGQYCGPGGDLVLASVLSLIFCTIGLGFVWGILGGSMPRSGGSYVYNARILHPAIGTAVSFCNGAFVMTAWIYLLAPWISDPGLVLLGAALGWRPELIEWFSTPAAYFLIATIVNIWALIVTCLPLRVWFWNQRILFILGMIGCTIACAVLTPMTRAQFIALWDAYAKKYGGPTFKEMIALTAADGFEVPHTWDYGVKMLWNLPAIAWATAYGYWIAFVGGEVKRPARNIFMAQVLAALVPSIYCIWLGAVLEKICGPEFLAACAYVDNEGPDWYTLPYPPIYTFFANLAVQNKFVDFLIGFNFIAFDAFWIPGSYICFSRALFAWGMDRLGPRWFTDVSPRWATPVKNNILEFVLSEIFIIWYCISPEFLGGLAVTALQCMSVFGITGVSCTIFPFVKKVRHIWEASPYREWKIGPVPVATISGIIYLIYVAILLWAFYSCPALEFLHPIWSPIYIAIWLFGFSWYFLWKWHVKKTEGLDVTLAFRELPPE